MSLRTDHHQYGGKRERERQSSYCSKKQGRQRRRLRVREMLQKIPDHARDCKGRITQGHRLEDIHV